MLRQVGEHLCSWSASVAAKYSPPVVDATVLRASSSTTRKFRPPPGVTPPPKSRPPPPNRCWFDPAELCGGAGHLGRVLGPEPDRVDPHTAGGGLDRGVLGGDAAGVRAVGEQHDDLRSLVPVGVRRRCGRRARAVTVLGRLGGRRPVGVGRILGRSSAPRSGSSSAIASIDLRIAAPMVVPRPVVTASRVLSRSVLFVVGATASWANPENSTRPILVSSPCVSTNLRTAACAAASRLGSTSVAHIEPETSRARITVELEIGTSALTCGRAAATPRSPRLAMTSATGRCRRQRRLGPTAVRTRATFEYRTAAGFRRRVCQRYAASRIGTASRPRRRYDWSKLTQITRPRRSTETTAPASSSRVATPATREVISWGTLRDTQFSWTES